MIYIEGFRYAIDQNFDAQDAAMRVLQTRGYIKYERTAINTRTKK